MLTSSLPTAVPSLSARKDCRRATPAPPRHCARKPSSPALICGSNTTGTFWDSTLRAPRSRVTRSTAVLPIASGGLRSAMWVDESYQ